MSRGAFSDGTRGTCMRHWPRQILDRGAVPMDGCDGLLNFLRVADMRRKCNSRDEAPPVATHNIVSSFVVFEEKLPSHLCNSNASHLALSSRACPYIPWSTFVCADMVYQRQASHILHNEKRCVRRHNCMAFVRRLLTRLPLRLFHEVFQHSILRRCRTSDAPDPSGLARNLSSNPLSFFLKQKIFCQSFQETCGHLCRAFEALLSRVFPSKEYRMGDAVCLATNTWKRVAIATWP